MRDRFNQMIGRTRFVVCRIFLHLGGNDVAPILGVLNRVARQVMDADGDLQVAGEGLVTICQSLLQADEFWVSAANEGEVYWSESEAGDFVNELFTDSAQRYLSEVDFSSKPPANQPLSIPITSNVVVMLTVACEGEVPELETDLSNVNDLKRGLKTLINLQYQGKLRAVQIHFSPAQIGDELTSDQLLQYFPELIPL